MEMWPEMPLWEWKIAFDLNHRFCSEVVFSSAGSVGQKLAGHLWASSNCCDCVISLLMKKPGETFDLENVHTAFRATFAVWMAEWEAKPSDDFFFFFYCMLPEYVCLSLMMFQQSMSCQWGYSYCLTSSVIPGSFGTDTREMACVFFELMLERDSGIKLDTNHLQISVDVFQTHAVLLLAKHI